MKRFLSFCLVFTLCVSLLAGIATAETVASDALWEYQVYGDGVELTAYNGDATDVYVPSFVEDVEGNRLDVLKLADGLFQNNDALNSATLGAGITEIGARAFEDCDNLVCIVTNAELTTIDSEAFSGCEMFNSVILLDAVTLIGENAFADCPNVTIWCNENSTAHIYAVEHAISYEILNPEATPVTYEENGFTYYIMNGEAIAIDCDTTLTSVTVPATVNGYPVTTLRETFKDNTALKTVTLSDGLKTIESEAFSGSGITSIEIPDSVTEVDGFAFYECKELKTATLSKNMKEVATYCFAYTGLTSVTIPGNIKVIREYAFCGCPGIENITICDGVESIEYAAFTSWGSSKYTELRIPGSVKTIASSAFYNPELESIVLEEGVQSFGSLFNKTKVTNVTIPSTVTKIDSWAFQDCKGLTEITIPGTVKSVGDYAFYNCTTLETVILEEGTERLGSYAFCHSDKVKTVRMPKSLRFEIGDDWYSVPKMIFPANTIWQVYEDSTAHVYAEEHDVLYSLLKKVENPEISFGTGVSGTVYYTNGIAAAGATVEILYDDGVVKETVVTDENGNYEFTYAEVGRYTIRATDSSGNTSAETVSVKRMNAFDVFLAGETTLVLKKGYIVNGTVSEKSTVSLTDRDGNVLAQVEADGAFVLENIPNGEYIVKAESETGSETKEITVYNGNVSGIELVLPTNTATVWGIVEVADRDGKTAPRNWVTVTIYNSNGVAVATTKSDANGKFTFGGLPIDEYAIVAETSEMRPDTEQNFDRNHKLTGYGYVNVTEVGTYDVGTIVLYEESAGVGTFNGKVTAQGETQDCEVILKNVFRHEIAKYTTKKNGKYTFQNIPDGLYFITAITKTDGMGFGVIVVRNGEFYGDTHIQVYKDDKIARWEASFYDRIPECADREAALLYKEAIAEEKSYYDGLSSKEKQQLSAWYIERLEQLCEWIADVEVSTTEGVIVEQSGLIVSGEELDSMDENDSISFALTVEKTTAHDASDDGINTAEDYIHHEIRDTAGDYDIVQYYEITMEKTDADGNVRQISDIARDTDANGELRVTMPIPEGYLGHKHYSLIHVHNGETVTLTDLDEDPATITFEVDAFSTFVLAATDVEHVGSYDDAIVSTVNGAQIRTTGNQGLRFISTVNKSDVAFSEIKEFGTVLIPTADLEQVSDLKIGAVLNGHTVAKVPAVNIYASDDNAITFTAVITNIQSKHYDREYTARAYAIMNDGSVVYADSGASRSVYGVAKKAVEAGVESEENMAIFRYIIDTVENKFGDNDAAWPW